MITLTREYLVTTKSDSSVPTVAALNQLIKDYKITLGDPIKLYATADGVISISAKGKKINKETNDAVTMAKTIIDNIIFDNAYRYNFTQSKLIVSDDQGTISFDIINQKLCEEN